MTEDRNRQQSAGQGRERQAQQFEQGSAQQRGSSGTDGDLMAQVREHMDVIGPDGQRIGRVDSVEGDRIKLTRQDSPDGQHRYIAASEIAGIEDGALRLSGDYASDDEDSPSTGYDSTGMAQSGSGFASGQ